MRSLIQGKNPAKIEQPATDEDGKLIDVDPAWMSLLDSRGIRSARSWPWFALGTLAVVAVAVAVWLPSRRRTHKAHYATATELWKHIRDNYFEGTPAEEAAAAQDKIRLLSSVRLMSWPLRHKAPQEDIDKCVSIYKAEIDEVLPRLDTLAL